MATSMRCVSRLLDELRGQIIAMKLVLALLLLAVQLLAATSAGRQPEPVSSGAGPSVAPESPVPGGSSGPGPGGSASAPAGDAPGR